MLLQVFYDILKQLPEIRKRLEVLLVEFPHHCFCPSLPVFRVVQLMDYRVQLVNDHGEQRLW